MTHTELSEEEAQLLLSQPTRRSRSSPKPQDLVRDLQTWFRFTHRIGMCSNPDCTTNTSHPSNLVAEVKGVDMCRVCYLEVGYMFTPETDTK